MNHTIRTLFVLTLLVVTTLCTAQNIRIQGTVTCEGKPVVGANISNTAEKGSIGLTDESGNFFILAPRDAELKITHVSYQEAIVPVKGRQQLNIELVANVVELEEVTIVTKVKNKVIPEPTDIEIQGNYFHLHTRFPVPAELFGSNTRLVIQPSIYDHTERTRENMKPLVFDGREYTLTQERMYDGDLTRDPLEPYITRKTTSGRKSDLLSYHDSLYVEHTGHDFRADVLLSLEDYNRILYTDSFTIARGTVKPMRLLDYTLQPLPLRDSTLIPRPEMQLRDSQGEIELTFLIGRTELDPNNPKNEEQIAHLAQEITRINQDVDASIKEVKITGVASPDGYYNANKRLAEQRAATALKKIQQQMGDELVRYVKFTAAGEVADWNDVAEMLEADQQEELLEGLRKALGKSSEHSLVYRSLKNHPGFDLLAKQYLPKLRKVTYQYEYSVFRNLNREEVLALHQEGKEQLSRYEYYLLSQFAENDSVRASYLEEALQHYDRYIYAANELAQIRIRQGKPDEKLLKPYAVRGTSPEVLGNHMIALMHHGLYAEALEVWNLLPTGSCDPLLEAVVMALNGHYEEAEPILCQGNPRNEVVFLLARKENKFK